MKRMTLLILICCVQNTARSQVTDTCSVFEGFHNILLGETTLKNLKENYPDSRVEKSRYVQRIVYLDCLGIKVYLQKEKFKNEYTVYHIVISENCTFKSKGGIGIGSTYEELAKVYPSILTEHSSRLTRRISNNKRSTSFSIYENSVDVTFYSNGGVNADEFITNQIVIDYRIHTEPYMRPTLAFMGLPRVECSTDFKSLSVYGGYGFYTTYFVTGNVGAEFRFSNNSFLLGPKTSLGLCIPGFPGGQFTFSTYMPIKNNKYDVILNPKLGINFPMGVFYLEAGYSFNLTRNFDVPNSINLTLGMQIPLNITKFVSNI